MNLNEPVADYLHRLKGLIGAPDQALAMDSSNGDCALGRQTQLGMIGKDQDADLVVLSDQLTNLPAENWEQGIDVEMTIANGKIIDRD